jgi:ribonuclease HI
MSTYSRQYVLLDTYSKLMSLTNPIESDFAKCAAEYINLSGANGASESFVLSILHRAKMYMSNELINDTDVPNKSDDNSPSSKDVSIRSDIGTEVEFSDNFVENDATLNVFCEGTSSGIGTSAAASGCGIYALYKNTADERTELKKKYILSAGEHISNQRAELSAFYAGLDVISKIKADNQHLQHFYIHISSKYAYMCATEWGKSWSSKKWKRAEGPIKNVDIIKPLYEKLQMMPFIKITLYQRDKSKKCEAVPEWFGVARDLAIQAIAISKNQSQSTSDTDITTNNK